MRMQLNVMVSNPGDEEDNLRPIKDNTILPMVWVEMVSNSKQFVPWRNLDEIKKISLRRVNCWCTRLFSLMGIEISHRK